MIRLAAPGIPEDDLNAVRQVLASGWLVQGEQVARFEAAVADFLGVEHAVAVSSGTAAIHAALLALGIGPGNAVAVSAYSHVASANAIEICGAEPVFVDVDPRTFNMDAGALERVLTDRAGSGGSPLTAILVVHAFGQMADVEAIDALASKHGLALIEDAACALGASWRGRQPAAGSRGACFSFHPRKAITTGEGGLIATGDDELANAARALRNHGQDPTCSTPDFIAPGLNYRMTEFQAALGNAALPRLRDAISRRRAIAARYDELLAGSVDVPFVPDGCDAVYQSYVVLLPANVASDRAGVIADMADRGVESTIGTWSIPTTSYYARRYGYTPASYAVTSDVFERALAIPMHEKLSDDDVSRVAEGLHRAVARRHESATL